VKNGPTTDHYKSNV